MAACIVIAQLVMIPAALLVGAKADEWGRKPLFPVVVADLTRRTGRFNVSLGAIATALGLGAALSATFAGLIVVMPGYSAAFLALAAIAGIGLVIYAAFMPETKPQLGQDSALIMGPARPS